MSVFEINIRFVGGLLSAYALSKDEVSCPCWDQPMESECFVCMYIHMHNMYVRMYV